MSDKGRRLKKARSLVWGGHKAERAMMQRHADACRKAAKRRKAARAGRPSAP